MTLTFHKRTAERKGDFAGRSNHWRYCQLIDEAARGLCEEIGRATKWSAKVLQDWMRPHSRRVSHPESTALFLQDLLRFGAERKTVEAIADAICHDIGGRYVRIEGRGAESIAAGCAEVSRETGELLAVVVASLEDGHLTDEEMEKIRTELRGAETSFAELAAAIDAAEVAR